MNEAQIWVNESGEEGFRRKVDLSASSHHHGRSHCLDETEAARKNTHLEARADNRGCALPWPRRRNRPMELLLRVCIRKVGCCGCLVRFLFLVVLPVGRCCRCRRLRSLVPAVSVFRWSLLFFPASLLPKMPALVHASKKGKAQTTCRHP